MSIEQRVECSKSGKILARVSQDGMKFWCERHRREEFFTWEELDAMRRSVTTAKVSDHTTAISQ